MTDVRIAKIRKIWRHSHPHIEGDPVVEANQLRPDHGVTLVGNIIPDRQGVVSAELEQAHLVTRVVMMVFTQEGHRVHQIIKNHGAVVSEFLLVTDTVTNLLGRELPRRYRCEIVSVISKVRIPQLILKPDITRLTM